MHVFDTVKFPYHICKGSVKQRKQLAFKLISSFDKRIDNEFAKSRYVSVNRIKKAIFETLPTRNVYLTVKKSQTNEDSLTHFINSKNAVCGYLLELSANNNHKINKYNKNSVIHETWHLFEQLLNPKIVARYQALSEQDFEKYYTFYEKHLYPGRKYNKRNIDINLNNFLSKFDSSKKINLLQLLRYDLIGELDAYSVANKFAPEASNFNEYYKFNEKIEIVSNKIKEIINAIRNRS